jgi:NTE family protein
VGGSVTTVKKHQPDAAPLYPSPPFNTMTKTINLAIQGGGAHGAFTWGVLDALIARPDLEIEGLSAASAGTMNAAVYAYGRMTGGRDGARAALENFWRKVAEVGAFLSPVRQLPWETVAKSLLPGAMPWNMDNSVSYALFETITRSLSPYQFNPFNLNPLREILASCVDFKALTACECVKLFISATHVRTGQNRVFYNQDVSLDAVMASACLPFLFQAIEIQGEYYWDGGYMGNPPLYPLFYHTVSRDILVLHINPVEREALPVEAMDITNRINEISFNSSLLQEFRAIAFVQRLLRDGYLVPEKRHEFKDVLMHAIRADKALADLSVVSKFNTDWQFLLHLRDRGQEVATAWLDRHYDDLNERSTVNLHETFLQKRVPG